MVQSGQITMQELAQIIVETSSKQRKEFQDENLVLRLCCEEPDAQPRVIAERYNQLAKGAPKNGNDIIRVFRRCKLDRISERISLLKKGRAISQQILEALEANDAAILDGVSSELDAHVQFRRIILLSLAPAWKSSLPSNAYQNLLRLNRDFAGECLDAILDLIAVRGKTKANRQGHLDAEAYEDEIFRLNNALTRANNLVTRLQDSYEEQMLEMRAEEEARMISMLNSEKYGYILDLLVSAQNGFRLLRKKGPIPFEIKSVQSLVRRLMEFVEDCDVVPILEIGERLSVRANEIDGYLYDGTPFASSDDTKQVEVISPGWKVFEKDIVISYPRVKELEKEAIR
ncbi:MAG: hypothetical protein HFF84_08690 [Oscillibacter sp.]|nr:hypothetical protein [Oscillibacter sp.]